MNEKEKCVYRVGICKSELPLLHNLVAALGEESAFGAQLKEVLRRIEEEVLEEPVFLHGGKPFKWEPLTFDAPFKVVQKDCEMCADLESRAIAAEAEVRRLKARLYDMMMVGGSEK